MSLRLGWSTISTSPSRVAGDDRALAISLDQYQRDSRSRWVAHVSHIQSRRMKVSSGGRILGPDAVDPVAKGGDWGFDSAAQPCRALALA